MSEAREANSRPVPDPTVLTTEQLLREISALEKLLDERLQGFKGEAEEKFRSVDRQFALVEQQRVEQKKDTKDAVDAALTAQKEAVREQTTASERSIAKSETATTKSIEQLGTTFNTAVEGLRRENADLKERIGVLETQRQSSLRGEDRSQPWQLWAVGIVGSAALAGIIILANILTGT